MLVGHTHSRSSYLRRIHRQRQSARVYYQHPFQSSGILPHQPQVLNDTSSHSLSRECEASQTHSLPFDPASLSAVKRQFAAAIAKYQDLWLVLEDLDANAWVLEPEHPTPADVARRIGIGNHCTLQLSLVRQSP